MIELRRAGERGVLLELAGNAEARRVADALRGLDGVIDVVPAHRTVLVIAKRAPDSPALVAAARAALDAEPGAETGRPIEIPVEYDGADLSAVARLAGLSDDEVVARHTAAEYVVGFIGFAPGFAYLLGGDERLHVPRLAEPRPRVPEGSVAVAGPYSAVYPRASPGGWRLLGRTPVTLFDPALDEPARLAPGDRVRFVRA
jgi:KipI family sensor histidine kinase inhibitor